MVRKSVVLAALVVVDLEYLPSLRDFVVVVVVEIPLALEQMPFGQNSG